MRFAVALLTLGVITGCAKQQHAKLPLKSGVNVEFRGIKNGACAVADVLVDAKTGGYTVICK